MTLKILITKKYLYEVDNTSCPSWYRIYTVFSNNNDQAIAEARCVGNVCGPYPSFSYGVSSPNIDLERGSSAPTPTPVIATPTPANPTPTPVLCQGTKYKLNISQQCNEFSGNISECTSQDPCYSDPGAPGYRGCFNQCAP